MGNILCSDNFRSFFYSIEKAHFSVDELSVHGKVPPVKTDQMNQQRGLPFSFRTARCEKQKSVPP